MNQVVSNASYNPPEEPTPAERHETRERIRQREKATRRWATRNRFPAYCLK